MRRRERGRAGIGSEMELEEELSEEEEEELFEEERKVLSRGL